MNISSLIYKLKIIKPHRKSYSQNGEDQILHRIFGKKSGFYIDVGAYHPWQYSNTYFFYRLGWRGINIDIQNMDLFEKYRKRDLNVKAAISDKNQKLRYYMFTEPALNTFDQNLADKRKRENNYLSSQIYQTIPLNEILDKHLKENQRIDFLNIDAEGLDYKILSSLDLSKYKPDIILVEKQNKHGIEFINYLISEYELFSVAFNTMIFKRRGII